MTEFISQRKPLGKLFSSISKDCVREKWKQVEYKQVKERNKIPSTKNVEVVVCQKKWWEYFGKQLLNFPIQANGENEFMYECI